MNQMVLTATANYCQHAASVVFSALEHLPNPFPLRVFLVLDQSPIGLAAVVETDAVFKAFQRRWPQFTWQFLHLQPAIDPKHLAFDYLPPITFYRLFLDTLIQGRALYVDCDMAFFGSIAPLFELKLGQAVVAMAPDQLVRQQAAIKTSTWRQPLKWIRRGRNKDYGLTAPTIATHGLPHALKYQNAGLAVIDFDNWRRCNVSKVITELGDINRFAMADQDVLNLISARFGFVEIEQTYNVQRYSRPPKPGALPVGFHYVSKHKPWLAQPLKQRSRRTPWAALYRKMLDRKQAQIAGVMPPAPLG